VKILFYLIVISMVSSGQLKTISIFMAVMLFLNALFGLINVKSTSGSIKKYPSQTVMISTFYIMFAVLLFYGGITAH